MVFTFLSFSPPSFPPSLPPSLAGITSVETNIEAKKVVVQAVNKVTAIDMLAALQKWGEAAGKEVSLA